MTTFTYFVVWYCYYLIIMIVCRIKFCFERESSETFLQAYKYCLIKNINFKKTLIDLLLLRLIANQCTILRTNCACDIVYSLYIYRVRVHKNVDLLKFKSAATYWLRQRGLALSPKKKHKALYSCTLIIFANCLRLKFSRGLPIKIWNSSVSEATS